MLSDTKHMLCLPLHHFLQINLAAKLTDLRNAHWSCNSKVRCENTNNKNGLDSHLSTTIGEDKEIIDNQDAVKVELQKLSHQLPASLVLFFVNISGFKLKPLQRTISHLMKQHHHIWLVKAATGLSCSTLA